MATGSAVNDYLIWAWGWEIDASLYAGYLNNATQGGLGALCPTVPGVYAPLDSDWVAKNSTYYPPNIQPPNVGAIASYGAGAPFCNSNFGPGRVLGDPYECGVIPINQDFAWSVDFTIIPNYDHKLPVFRYGFTALASTFFPVLSPYIVQVHPGDLGPSFNADFNDPLFPGRNWSAGNKCLLLAGWYKTYGDNTPHPTTPYDVPMLWTPHIGTYNRAVSASAVAGTVGANETKGPPVGWVQTSYKAVCNQYSFMFPTDGQPSALAGPSTTNNPAHPGGGCPSGQCVTAGGSPISPIITLWDEYPGHASQMMIIGLFPEDQAPEPVAGALAHTSREVMLAIAPDWANGIGPNILLPGAGPGPTFTFNWDRDWHRIAIKYALGKDGGHLTCTPPGTPYISASVYLDGVEVAAAVVCKTLNDTWHDWNRIGLGPGVAPVIFGQEMWEPDNLDLAPRRHYTAFGMHDHLFVWGSPLSDGKKKLYIQGVKPDEDVHYGSATIGLGEDPWRTGFWRGIGVGATQPTGWDVINDRNDPDIWGEYGGGSLFSMPTAINSFNNVLTGCHGCVGLAAAPLVPEMGKNDYKFALQSTREVNNNWRPANIYGVQQISIHSQLPGGDPLVEAQYVYTTMSIGNTLIDSWPSPQYSWAASVPGADKAVALEKNDQNIVYIFSSASSAGSLWTYQQVDLGTGSIFMGAS